MESLNRETSNKILICAKSLNQWEMFLWRVENYEQNHHDMIVNVFILVI